MQAKTTRERESDLEKDQIELIRRQFDKEYTFQRRSSRVVFIRLDPRKVTEETDV